MCVYRYMCSQCLSLADNDVGDVGLSAFASALGTAASSYLGTAATSGLPPLEYLGLGNNPKVI